MRGYVYDQNGRVRAGGAVVDDGSVGLVFAFAPESQLFAHERTFESITLVE